MIVDDFKVEKMFVEPGKNQLDLDDDPYEMNISENIIKFL